MRLPKYVYAKDNKYQVLIPKLETKGKSNHYIGTYSSLAAAIVSRDNALEMLGENRKTGKNPAKGVTVRTSKNKGLRYDADIQFIHRDKHIHLALGTFDTLEEAIQSRIDFLDNLK